MEKIRLNKKKVKKIELTESLKNSKENSKYYLEFKFVNYIQNNY